GGAARRVDACSPRGRQRGGSEMDDVRLGNSGLKVSRIALGMMSFGSPASRPWQLDQAAAEPIVRRAVEAGVNFFHTPHMYAHGAGRGITRRPLPEPFPPPAPRRPPP